MAIPSVILSNQEMNWSALRARMVMMAQPEKIVYLESMIREVSRNHSAPAKIVQQLKDMQEELNEQSKR